MKENMDTACRVHVVVVSPLESDHITLAHIFGHTAWKFESARTLRDASEKLFHSPLRVGSPVILCEETLPDGTWKDLLQMTQKLSDPPKLVVTSQCADDRLWAEVLNLGAYDVLQRPFRAQEVFHTIGLAWNDGRKMSVVSAGGPRIATTAVA